MNSPHKGPVTRKLFPFHGVILEGLLSLSLNKLQRVNSIWPWGWFNIKMSSYQYSKSHCEDKTMGFPILVRWYLYIESGPRSFRRIFQFSEKRRVMTFGSCHHGNKRGRCPHLAVAGPYLSILIGRENNLLNSSGTRLTRYWKQQAQHSHQQLKPQCIKPA